jgi:hypothetical protein
MIPFLLSIFFFFCISNTLGQRVKTVDICVYGGTSAGVIAAYSAKKMGKSVLLIESGKRLGGLTSGGLGYTDIGNKYAITGLSLDFFRRIGKHYGNFEQWIFEPSVAEETFQSYIHSGNVSVMYEYQLKAVKTSGGYIKEIVVESSENNSKRAERIIRAKMFIDCSYEGDLMAKSGVSYIVGREANGTYGETYDGVQLGERHQFPNGIDPYKTPGNPSSGLLWGISKDVLLPEGSGDNKVQAYNFRICLTNVPSNRIEITRPNSYDSTKYELLLRYIDKIHPKDLNPFLKIDVMANGKTDINNNGPFSTDMIGMNYNYPDGSYETRKKITTAHENYTKGLLYFIGHDERMPKYLREQMLQWGYPKDEYKDNGHWSPQMYIREARRMKGAYIMTQANCQGRITVEDGIAMAAYTMDSHNCERIIIEKGGVKMVKNEGNVEIGGFSPYPISYRAIVPKEDQCKNLLVPVCLSASHIAYGSIRMEPVFMVLAQSAAVAASMAIDKNVPVHEIDVVSLQRILKENPLLDGSKPDIIVDDADKNVSITGRWRKVTKSCYGPSMLLSDSENNVGKVRFMPIINEAGYYTVYTYVPIMKKMADTIQVIIYDGTERHYKNIMPDKIKIKGQTSGEWVYLGDFNFKANNRSYVEISNHERKGVVMADAVLLKKKN